MGAPLPMPSNVRSLGRLKTKSGKGEYSFGVACVRCGVERVVKRRQHAIGMSQKPCKRCSNKSNHPIGLCGSMRLSFFNKYKINAEVRSKSWNITAEQASEALERQGFRCALSGLPISASGDLDKMTASLDRIDNSIGYEPGNIQWVHKDVNMLRGALTIEKFLELCDLVAKHTKQQSWF